MGRAMRSAFCCLWVLAARAMAQTVEGTVVDSVTGTGIPAANVHLRPASGEKDYSATTDALGHFLLKNVEPGTYMFLYSQRDYLSSDMGRQVRISDQSPAKLEGRMARRPRISGRAVDADGNGLANATVEVIPEGSWSATTDATGKFELMLDRRGAYVISLVPPMNLKPPAPEPDSDGPLIWARVFYPGVLRLDSASKIAVSDDATVPDLKLQAVLAHAVRGVLLNPDGTPAPKVTVTLDDGERPRGQSPASAAHTESRSDGVFEFPEVVDGEWRLAAEVEISGRKLRATQWIEMTGRELEGVSLRLASPFTVRGHVVVEARDGKHGGEPFPVFLIPHGRSTHSDIGYSNWMLSPSEFFEPAVPSNVPDANEAHDAFVEITTNSLVERGAVLAKPDADGSFGLENVYPGSYRVASLPPPPPYYMAAVLVGDANLSTPEADLSSVTPPITVLFKSNGGSVGGTVEKCANGIVVLIPQDPAMQSLGFFRSGRCDGGDRYQIPAVRPGGYYALAFVGSEGVPQLDDVLLSQASTITVRVNETTSADLRTIQRPGH
jgi:Carboxypeptidase regulatory-like domain